MITISAKIYWTLCMGMLIGGLMAGFAFGGFYMQYRECSGPTAKCNYWHASRL